MRVRIVFLIEAFVGNGRVDLVAVFWRTEGIQQWVDRRVKWKHKNDEPSVNISWDVDISECQNFHDNYWSPTYRVGQNDEEKSAREEIA